MAKIRQKWQENGMGNAHISIIIRLFLTLSWPSVLPGLEYACEKSRRRNDTLYSGTFRWDRDNRHQYGTVQTPDVDFAHLWRFHCWIFNVTLVFQYAGKLIYRRTVIDITLLFIWIFLAITVNAERYRCFCTTYMQAERKRTETRMNSICILFAFPRRYLCAVKLGRLNSFWHHYVVNRWKVYLGLYKHVVCGIQSTTFSLSNSCNGIYNNYKEIKPSRI